MEATMYALLAGCHNLGATISSSTGAFVLQVLDCQPRGIPNESIQFERFWIASTISTVLPLIVILLAFKLIPDARQDEQIVTTTCDACSGSLLRRWTGQDH